MADKLSGMEEENCLLKSVLLSGSGVSDATSFDLSTVFVKEERGLMSEEDGTNHTVVEMMEMKVEEPDAFSEIVTSSAERTSLYTRSGQSSDTSVLTKEEDLGMCVEEENESTCADFESCESLKEKEDSCCGEEVDKVDLNHEFIELSLANAPAHDIVCSLLEVPFTQRNCQQQKDILCVGRPRLHLTALQKDKVNGRTFSRSFNVDNFRRCEWLCSSIYKQSLFCWPCLLLEQNERKKTVWCSAGYSNYKNLSRGLSRHESSKDHIVNYCNLKKIEKAHNPIKDTLIEHANLTKAQFNENVRMNRSVMRILIDAVIYLDKQELTFRGYNESTNLTNFKELLVLLLKHSSPEIQVHYRTIEPVFTGGPKTIQNELIECVQEVILDKIEADLNEVPFFSCQMNNTTDMAHKAQNSIIVRFVDASGQIVERFLGFFNVSENKNASALFNLLDSQLQRFNYRNKLIGQTFDGASVMAGEVAALQKQVKSVAPSALFTHFSGHRLNLVLQHGTGNISECWKFFSHVISMATYFHESPLRSSVADKIIKHRFPQIVDTCWYSHSKILRSISQYFPDLRTIFNAIIDDPLQSAESHTGAVGFLHILSQFDFAFLTLIFKDIFDKADVLNDIFQKKSLDIRYCVTHVEALRRDLILQQDKDYANDYYNKALQLIALPSVSRNASVSNLAKRRLYYGIIANIVLQLTERFCDLEKLLFLELADSSKFSQYCAEFPDAALKSLHKFYPAHFPDIPRLKCELEVMYGDAVYHEKSIQGIIEMMRSMDLHKILKEAYTLMLLVASISATAVSEERSFSTLKRIETHPPSTMLQERLSNVTFLSVEKELLGELMAQEDFYVRVIKKFDSKKSCRIDLAFKP